MKVCYWSDVGFSFSLAGKCPFRTGQYVLKSLDSVEDSFVGKRQDMPKGQLESAAVDELPEGLQIVGLYSVTI